jgi:hypothetical protein
MDASRSRLKHDHQPMLPATPPASNAYPSRRRLRPPNDQPEPTRVAIAQTLAAPVRTSATTHRPDSRQQPAPPRRYRT